MTTDRNQARNQIKKDTEAFLAAGNEIKRLPIRQVKDLKDGWNAKRTREMGQFNEGI
jgi:hypothetical protein